MPEMLLRSKTIDEGGDIASSAFVALAQLRQRHSLVVQQQPKKRVARHRKVPARQVSVDPFYDDPGCVVQMQVDANGSARV
jgi:hypothetical protein